jgi:hypothetical protein
MMSESIRIRTDRGGHPFRHRWCGERAQSFGQCLDLLLVRLTFHQSIEWFVGRGRETMGQAGSQHFSMGNAAGAEIDFLLEREGRQGLVDMADQNPA